MITMGKHKFCDGTGQCYRCYKKYYFASYDKVECKYNCQMKRCKKCNFEAPEWYFKQYTSGLCWRAKRAPVPYKWMKNSDYIRTTKIDVSTFPFSSPPTTKRRGYGEPRFPARFPVCK